MLSHSTCLILSIPCCLILAVGVADIAAHEGSPHNVLHLSSYVVCIILLVIIMCSCLLPCTCDVRREEGE